MPRREWDEEDEWVERSFHRGYGHVDPTTLLQPGYAQGSSMRRSRSTGQRPQPIINMYQRTDNSRSPPRGRRGDPELVDAIEDVAYEIRRGRSRTPGGFREPSPGYYQSMQLELARERLRWDEHDRADARERAENSEALIRTREEIRRLKDRILMDERDIHHHKSDDESIRSQLELQKLRDEVKAKNDELHKKEQRELILAEKEREERDASLERHRVVTEYAATEAKKKKDAEKATELAIAEFEKKKKDEKKKREALITQIKLEEEEKKRKEKEEEEEWKLRLEKKEADRKKKEKEKEAELEDEMRKRLSKFGFQNNQIEAMIDAKKVDALKPGASPNKPVALVPFKHSNPTYIKVHRDHIDIQTLHYFGLPWEYDSSNTDYIIILQEMDTRETDILFEHTKKLRRGGTQLLIEERGRKHHQPEYAFVRRRKPSASPIRRRRSSPKGVLRLW